MKKNLKTIGCICIQVVHTRVNSQNKMTFHVVCAKKTTRVVRKKSAPMLAQLQRDRAEPAAAAWRGCTRAATGMRVE